MTVRRITITDHSPTNGGMPAIQILEVEMKGTPEAVAAATTVLCDNFKAVLHNAVMVEDLITKRSEVLSIEAFGSGPLSV